MTSTLPAPGRRTGVQVIIPPDRLPSHRVWSRAARRFSADEVRAWNERNAPLLSMYGLEIADASVLPIDVPLPARGVRGPLQTELRDRLLLTSALGALAVSLAGRGDLLAVPPPGARPRQAILQGDQRPAFHRRHGRIALRPAR